jgi:hypothetical protein
MNRKLLSEAAPRWIAIQALPAQVKFDLTLEQLRAAMDAVRFRPAADPRQAWWPGH